MDTQEVRDLYEAYLRVHKPQELTEEVEIAAQYFYEMGLNEEGVEILIEELGVEEFSEFVYDLAEEYYLTEARAGGVRVEPVTAKGTKFKGGKPTGKSLERLRAKKAARIEAEASASEAKPSGLTSSLRRQSAVSDAAKKQPKKKGILDRVAGAVNRGLDAAKNKAQKDIETRKKFMSNVRGTVEVAKKAAGKVGGVAKEVGKGASGAVKFAAAVTREEVEAWVGNLLEEGYDLSEYTWDDMCEMYLDEARRADREGYARGTAANPTRAQTDVPHSDPSQRTRLHSRLRQRSDQMGRERRNSPRNRSGGRTPVSPKEKAFLQAGDRTSPGRGHVRSPNVGDTGSHAEWPSQRRDQRDPKKNPKHSANRENAAESFDLFDTILEYLVAEGYADTNESALVIMANMSEEWRESIVEKHATFGYNADDPGDDFDQFVQKGPKTNKQKRQAIELNKKILSKKKN